MNHQTMRLQTRQAKAAGEGRRNRYRHHKERRHLQRAIDFAKLSQHNTPDDCWVIFDNNIVYDVTTYAPTHNPGAVYITSLCGTDGTDGTSHFNLAHPLGFLSFVAQDMVGVFTVVNGNAAPVIAHNETYD